jgi:hypothetical protein
MAKERQKRNSAWLQFANVRMKLGHFQAWLLNIAPVMSL